MAYTLFVRTQSDEISQSDFLTYATVKAEYDLTCVQGHKHVAIWQRDSKGVVSGQLACWEPNKTAWG